MLAPGAEEAAMSVVTLALYAVAALVLALVFVFVRYVPNNRIGVAEKRWATAGSVSSGVIAMKGEAGFQPDVIRGGVHILNRFQYRLWRTGQSDPDGVGQSDPRASARDG
jgi:uncharacterized membrane protein YqiK